LRESKIEKSKQK